MKETFKTLKFTNWCIENRTAVYVFTIILTLAGYVGFSTMPKEQFPDVVVPTITISTVYPGATPIDIENLITKPLEKQIKAINGMKKLKSKSISNVSIITAEFNTDMEVDKAKREVQQAVDKAMSELPSDLDEDPEIQEFDISEMPIMNINLYGDLPMDKIQKFADELEEKIETLPQITRVDIIGGLKREIQINIDLDRMQAAGITFRDIENAVAQSNINISAGEVEVGKFDRNMRIAAQFDDMKDIENIMVSNAQGVTLKLKNIANIVDGYKERDSYARLGGKPVITLDVIKRAGENLLAASDQIKSILNQYKKDKFPDALHYEITGDQSDATRTNLRELFNTVIIGFILVLIILMFFMGLKSAFFVAIAGPLSALVAFLILPSMGFTLNIIVLFSFLLALGIIVDDAIVVIENTHRLLHKYDFGIKKSAKYGAGEIFVPVLAGTLTTLGPFVPLLFWPGLVGNFMYYLPATLIVTLGASLLVAFVMNPVFAVSFMKKNEHLKKPSLKRLFIVIGFLVVIGIIAHIFGSPGFGNLLFVIAVFAVLNHYIFIPMVENFQNKIWPKFNESYHRLVLRFTKGKRPVIVVFSSVLLLILSALFFINTKPTVEFFPSSDPNQIFVYLEYPMGTDAETTNQATKELEHKIYQVLGKHNPDVESIVTNVGVNAGNPQNPDFTVTPHKGRITINFVNYADRHDLNTAKVLEKLRDVFRGGIPGGTVIVGRDNSGPPTGADLAIEIYGENFQKLQQIEQTVRKKINEAGIEGIENLQSNLELNKPEIIVDIDEEKAQIEGISLAQIGLTMRTALFGKDISKYFAADEETDIRIRLKEKYRNTPQDLLRLNIAFMDMTTGRYKEIPVSSLAKLKYNQAFSAINHINQKRVVTLSSNVAAETSSTAVNAKIRNLISEMDLPSGYTIKLGGQQEDQAETSNFLSVAFLAALVLMYLVMVVQFNSAIKPLIIFTTVLFSLIGVFFGFGITGMNISIVMTGVGMFALAGIVIRNGILIIEFIDQQREEGIDVHKAAVEAGRVRMTPVILTAMAAILGLLPLAVGFSLNFSSLFTSFEPDIHLGGDNVAFWGPLAWTIIFGLIVATFLTLLVVPSLYVFAYETKYWFIRKFTTKKS